MPDELPPTSSKRQLSCTPVGLLPEVRAYRTRLTRSAHSALSIASLTSSYSQMGLLPDVW